MAEFPHPHLLKLTELSSQIDLTHFECGDTDLTGFLKDDALRYQSQHVAHTTCVFFEDILVAYFSVAADALRLIPDERKNFQDDGVEITTFPAVKVARMAVITPHQNSGIGRILLGYVKGYALDLNRKGLAVRFITVDAYPQKVEFYKKCGFIPNGAHTGRMTISMRCDLYV